jgi:hypothetical protein
VIFARRGRRGPDPYLDWKVRFFFLAAVLAFAGIAADSSVLVGLAILVLLGGFALRIVPVKEKGKDTDSQGEPVVSGEEADADEPGLPS